jgi:hypothetical protein
MSVSGKDSGEVIKFLGLLTKLKEWSDDDPDGLRSLASADDGVRELCDQLFWIAQSLRTSERHYPQLFASPVNPKVIAAWREFEERFENVIGEIWLDGLGLGLIPTSERRQQKEEPRADWRWENADAHAKEEAEVIQSAVDYANAHATEGIIEGTYRETIEHGIAAWERLKSEAGFDLRGVFRRRQLVPFVLVPRHVAAKQASAEALSLLKNLREAHDAFVFGTPLACLAVMRSIVEVVLRDHYGVGGNDLNELIHNAQHLLPRSASPAALHRLRRIANAILHLEKNSSAPLDVEWTGVEKQIVSFLFILRGLVEGAPPMRGR